MTNYPIYPEIEVDLTNTNRNAFSIIGTVTLALRRKGVFSEQCKKFRVEAMSGDYDNVLLTCAKWVTII